MDDVRGLKNSGNMCFLNVIIQAFWNSPCIREFILNLKRNNHSHFDIKHSKELIEYVKTLKDVINDDDNIIHENISLLEQFYSASTSEKDKEVDDCLLCFLCNFLYNYQFSKDKKLDAYNMKEVLVSLNNNIQKFSFSGVKQIINLDVVLD